MRTVSFEINKLFEKKNIKDAFILPKIINGTVHLSHTSQIADQIVFPTYSRAFWNVVEILKSMNMFKV